MKKLYIIMLVFLFIAGGCAGKAQTPGERALEAMELIRDGNFKALEDYILKEDIPGTGFFFGLFLSAFSERGGIKKLEVESENIEGDTASVTVHWYYKNGGSAHETLPMRREDGKWRIDL